MADRKSTRFRPGRAAAHAARQFPRRARTRRRTPASDAHSFLEGEQECRDLSVLVARLRTIRGIAVTAQLALRQQHAEQDIEIADCLRTGVCDPIADGIQELQSILEGTRCHPAVGRS